MLPRTRSFKRTLIFCNTVKSCRAAEHALREVDLPSLSYHGEVPSDERSVHLERFKEGKVDFLVGVACSAVSYRDEVMTLSWRRALYLTQPVSLRGSRG